MNNKVFNSLPFNETTNESEETCSLLSLNIASLGLIAPGGSESLSDALHGLNLYCKQDVDFSFQFNNGSELELSLSSLDLNEIYTSETLECNLDSSILIDIPFYDGTTLDCIIYQSIQCSINIESGEYCNVDLDTIPISRGGSQLEVDNLIDSRRKVTVSIHFKHLTWTDTQWIQTIHFDNLRIISQFLSSQEKIINIQLSQIKLKPSITVKMKES